MASLNHKSEASDKIIMGQAFLLKICPICDPVGTRILDLLIKGNILFFFNVAGFILMHSKHFEDHKVTGSIVSTDIGKYLTDGCDVYTFLTSTRD